MLSIWCMANTKKTPASKKFGIVLMALPLLVIIGSQLRGKGLIWIDPHPATPPAVAAQGGVVVGDALHISLAVMPLGIALALGLVLIFAKPPEEMPQ